MELVTITRCNSYHLCMEEDTFKWKSILFEYFTVGSKNHRKMYSMDNGIRTAESDVK